MDIPIIGQTPGKQDGKVPLTEEEVLTFLGDSSEAVLGFADLYTQATEPAELGRLIVQKFQDEPEVLNKIAAGLIAAGFMSLQIPPPDLGSARETAEVLEPVMKRLEKLQRRAAGLVG